MKANGKIGAGIIGIGNWGRYGHVPVLRLLPEFEIVAVASRRQEAAQQLAREFHIAHAFVDADELINHPDVDLIIVLPPAPQHVRSVRAAITARKNVYCEWPLTTILADTEDLLRRAQEAGIRHAVGLQRRMGPSARYVRDLLAQGYVGQIRSVRMHVSMNYFQGRRSTVSQIKTSTPIQPGNVPNCSDSRTRCRTRSSGNRGQVAGLRPSKKNGGPTRLPA